MSRFLSYLERDKCSYTYLCQMSERLTKLKEFLSENPNDSFLIFAIAKEYEKLNELNKAAENYDLIIQNEPEYVGVYYHRAKLHETLNENEQAVAVYKQGLEVAKRTKDFHAASELNTALMNLELELDD